MSDMRMRLCILSALTVALAACGSTSPSKEAGQIFDSVTSTMTDFHLDLLDNGELPDTATWDCDQGTIELRKDESSGLTLEHTLNDCRLNCRTYSGELPYRNIESCDPGFTIDIVGTVQIEGSTHFEQCEFDAQEHCDATFSGRVCGFELGETGFDGAR
jgi:hypothetical protein